MYDDDTEVARNCKVFDDYLALSCILGAGLRTERLPYGISIFVGFLALCRVVEKSRGCHAARFEGLWR